MPEILLADSHDMLMPDGVSGQVWHNSEVTDGNETYSVTDIVEGLSESDREIVADEAAARVEDYTAVIDDVESQAVKLEAAPARVLEASKTQAEKLMGDMYRQVEEDLALDYTSGRTSTVTFLKEDIFKIRTLQSTLQQVRDGVKLKTIGLSGLEVVIPRRSLTSTKRQAVETQLSVQLHQAQRRVLESVEVNNDDDVYKRAVSRTASKVSTEQAVDYADGTADVCRPAPVDSYDPKLLVAAAIGTLDKDKAQQAFSDYLSQRVAEQVNGRASSAMERASVRYTYNDHTLAGQKARKEIHEKGMDDRLLAAYRSHMIARGMPAVDTEVTCIQYRSEWVRNATHAQKKFESSVLSGDTELAHYSPYALEVARNGGLRPKDEHGFTSKNNRSSLVHFTSLGEAAGGEHIDYTKYAQASGNVGNRMSDDPTVKPVAGAFTMSLAKAVGDGYNCATLTVKEVDGRKYPDDIILSKEDGTASVPLEAMDLTLSRLGAEYSDNPRFAYDHLVGQCLDEIRASYAALEQPEDWQDFVARNLDTQAVARQLLIDSGADPEWASRHVFSSDGNAQEESPASARTVIVPLATTRRMPSVATEHVDGKGSTLQTVVLGVSSLKAA